MNQGWPRGGGGPPKGEGDTFLNWGLGVPSGNPPNPVCAGRRQTRKFGRLRITLQPEKVTLHYITARKSRITLHYRPEKSHYITLQETAVTR